MDCWSRDDRTLSSLYTYLWHSHCKISIRLQPSSSLSVYAIQSALPATFRGLWWINLLGIPFLEKCLQGSIYNYMCCGILITIFLYVLLYQALFDHVKVGLTPILALHNLWRQIYMFLDILEFKVENKKKVFRKNWFGNVVSGLSKNGLNCL